MAGEASSARDKADALFGLAALDEELGRRDEAFQGYQEALAAYQAMQTEPDMVRTQLALDRLHGQPRTPGEPPESPQECDGPIGTPGESAAAPRLGPG